MKKVLLLSLTALSLFSCNKKPVVGSELHWRNTPWDISADSLTYLRTENYAKVYCRSSEKLCIGSESIDSVRYIFFNGELEATAVYLTTSTLSKVKYLSKIEDSVIHSLDMPYESCNGCDQIRAHMIHISEFEEHPRIFLSDYQLRYIDSIEKLNLNWDKIYKYYTSKFGKFEQFNTNGVSSYKLVRGSYIINLHLAVLENENDIHDYISYNNSDITKARSDYAANKQDSVRKMLLRQQIVIDSTKLAKELSVCPL